MPQSKISILAEHARQGHTGDGVSAMLVWSLIIAPLAMAAAVTCTVYLG